MFVYYCVLFIIKIWKNAIFSTHVYTLLSKYKNDNTNLLILSYLAGNTSTNLYNTINKNLYNKLKNNQITKQKYNNILKKIIIIYNGN